MVSVKGDVMHSRGLRTSQAFLIFAVSGCYPLWSYNPFEESEVSSGEAGGEKPTTAGSTSTGAVTTGNGPGSSGTGSSGAVGTSTGGGSSDEGQTFILPDSDGLDGECDLHDQACPPGQKCTFYSDSGSWYGGMKCVPVMEDPVGLGEPCSVAGPSLSGLDNCEAGAFCFDSYEGHPGTCTPICTYEAGMYTCPPGYALAYARDVVCMCLPACDPLVQDCVNPDDECVEIFGHGFYCVFDASGEGGQVHEPCDRMNGCDPGLACTWSGAAIECDQQTWGCCEPYCDLTQPNTCPGQGQVCNPVYPGEYAPKGYEHIGTCAVPM